MYSIIISNNIADGICNLWFSIGTLGLPKIFNTGFNITRLLTSALPLSHAAASKKNQIRKFGSWVWKYMFWQSIKNWTPQTSSSPAKCSSQNCRVRGKAQQVKGGWPYWYLDAGPNANTKHCAIKSQISSEFWMVVIWQNSRKEMIS